jgi:hypothetical protein
MRKVAEYLAYANECRTLALTTHIPAHKEVLLRMAQTWTDLAHARQLENDRAQRIQALAPNEEQAK